SCGWTSRVARPWFRARSGRATVRNRPSGRSAWRTRRPTPTGPRACSATRWSAPSPASSTTTTSWSPTTRVRTRAPIDAHGSKNIKWVAGIGSQSYGNPVVANGMLFCGSNNEAQYDKNFNKDAGVLLAFDAKTGKFLWQAVSPKLAAGRVNDWPFQGVCSSALVENNLLYYTTNRCETVCYDVSPLMAGDQPKQEWNVDMRDKLGVFPHTM